MTKVDGYDRFGVPYALVGRVKAGCTCQVDGGFTCIAPYSFVEIKSDETGLYFDCKQGQHFLRGQDKNGSYYAGLYFLSEGLVVNEIE